MWSYSQAALDHYLSPRHQGLLNEPSLVGWAMDSLSGDALRLYLKLDDQDVIEDVGYELEGNRTGLASASAFSELILNRHIESAAKVSPNHLTAVLEELPEVSFNQKPLATQAFRNAFDQWKRSRGTNQRYICYCLSVAKESVTDAIREGYLTTVEQVSQATRAGTGCASCHPEIASLINEVQQDNEHDFERRQRVKESKRTLTPSEQARFELIEEVLENEIRPGIRLDGGDIELVDVDGSWVGVSLSGACTTCPSSQTTLRYMVELKLRELVDPSIEVGEA